MAKYYSLMLSPNISKTPEGYLVCRNVPICRSGFQEYQGKELVAFPGYEESWGLEPDKTYKIFRPKEEVLHPETIASFEGKTVVNEHPEGNVVHVDNDAELNCGHAEQVRPGVPLPDGEVTLQADLVIKDPDLIEKVWPEGDPDSGVRDISCGYSLKLKRLADGAIAMVNIRGNHIAVVEKGRAGNLVAIKDSAPHDTGLVEAVVAMAIGDSAPPEIKKEGRKPIMSLKQLIFGRGVKAIMPDASPEEVSAVIKEMEEKDKPKTEMESKPETKPVAKDSLEKQDELAAEHPHRTAAHAALDRCLDARGADDHMGKDAFGKASHLDNLKKELLKYIEEEEAEPEHQDKVEAEPEEEEADAEPPELEKLEEEKKPAVEPEEEEEEHEADAEPEPEKAEEEEEEEEKPANDEEIENKGESVLKQANDSVRVFIRASRPFVAAIIAKPKNKWTPREKTMVDSYNKAIRGVNKAGPAYKVLAKVKVPAKIPALAVDAAEAAAKAKTEADTISGFYEGVPFATGKRRHDEYLKTKGSK